MIFRIGHRTGPGLRLAPESPERPSRFRPKPSCLGNKTAMRLSRFPLLMVFALLAACTMQPLPLEKAADYKRVGILSAMGQEFSKKTVGVLVFGNDYEKVQVDFGADGILTRRLSQALSTRYEVVDLSRYRSAFIEAPKMWPGHALIPSDDDPTVAKVVHRLMGAEALDAYIIVTPSGTSVGQTNQSVWGLGLLKRDMPFGSSVYKFHAAYIVSVVDGTTPSLVADMRALPVGGSNYFASGWGDGSHINAPSRIIWPETRRGWCRFWILTA